MKKEELEIMDCKRCNIQPKVVNIDGLYYTYCPKCKHHGMYNCCGLSRESSIEQWNVNNRAINTYNRYQQKYDQRPRYDEEIAKLDKKELPHVIILRY